MLAGMLDADLPGRSLYNSPGDELACKSQRSAGRSMG